MVKIDNNFLKEYLTLDREIKQKTKQRNRMKDEITKELNNRGGKAIVTRLFIASFELMKRVGYNVPDNIKQKYRKETEYNLLKVVERKPVVEPVERKDNDGGKKSSGVIKERPQLRKPSVKGMT